MTRTPVIVWMRQDLRVDDNPAVEAACATGQPVIFLFIWAPEEEGEWSPGGATRWWLHHSLSRLAETLEARGNRLLIRRGPSAATLDGVIAETGASVVFWNRRYEPLAVARDAGIKSGLRQRGLRVESFNAGLLREPWEVATKTGGPYQVFTPYWRACMGMSEPSRPWVAPTRFAAPHPWPIGVEIGSLGLLPRIGWDEGFRGEWTPGSDGAVGLLSTFVAGPWRDYKTNRDRPDLLGTSRLSPHLHFGEIGPRQIWWAVKERAGQLGLAEAEWRSSTYLTEVGWREFAYHLMFHFPRTPTEPLRDEFSRFPWREETELLKRWSEGRTGVPLVDAGMRQLWRTGWMHNRVRMVVASYLVKNLMVPWQSGARWFWDTLVDADLASNTLGWQWTAGCGADAAPYFRVFNPVSQGEKFDPNGEYVRRWVPELGRLELPWIHRPWEAPSEVLRGAGVSLGRDYPEPLVSLVISRERTLEAYARMRAGRPVEGAEKPVIDG